MFFEGADIYRKAGLNNLELIREYGKGVPDDWFEHFFYGPRNRERGVLLTLIIELILFGLPALIIWPIQMLVIPVIAAGFINGIAHVWEANDTRMESLAKKVASLNALVMRETSQPMDSL